MGLEGTRWIVEFLGDWEEMILHEQLCLYHVVVSLRASFGGSVFVPLHGQAWLALYLHLNEPVHVLSSVVASGPGRFRCL